MLEPCHETIQPRDWFILATRVIGVWALYNAVTYLAIFAEVFIGYRVETDRDNSRTMLVQAVFHFIFALYLLFGTRHLTRHIYGEEKNCAEAESSTQSNETTQGE